MAINLNDYAETVMYTQGSEGYNEYLRLNQKDEDMEETISSLLKELNTLLVSKPLLTYRGQEEKYLPVGFISTSLSPEIAKTFGPNISVFWGYGANLIGISSHTHELEILYPPTNWVDIEGVYVPQGMEEEYQQWLVRGSLNLIEDCIPKEAFLNPVRRGVGLEVALELPILGWSRGMKIPYKFLPTEGIKALYVTQSYPDEGWEIADTL